MFVKMFGNNSQSIPNLTVKHTYIEPKSIVHSYMSGTLYVEATGGAIKISNFPPDVNCLCSKLEMRTMDI